MKGKGKAAKWAKTKKESDEESDEDVGDIFTDEISEFTDARNKTDLDVYKKASDDDEEEEIFGLVDEDDESDEEIGEWTKRLKQVKFQAKLDKKKDVSDAPEKSWGNKRTAFYGSGVRRKPKQASSDEDDEWTMEEKEIEKLQQKLDEDIDEEDFLLPSLIQKPKAAEQSELTVRRDLNDQEKEEMNKQLHPEAEPLRLELNKCMEELEKLIGKKGWKIESRDTCFRLLAANIAFYLHLIENNEDCRGHPVLKRIIQWKKLAKMYEAVPLEEYETEDEGSDIENGETHSSKIGTKKREKSMDKSETKRARVAVESSDDELGDINDEEEKDGELESRPVTYEIEKNKPKVKTVPNNPRVKNREKFRKAKIRRRGKIREYRPAVNKYQGEASGIRAGVVRSVRLQ
ncbi:unnamed protein product [Candidula unifasciata]|uniref:Sas10 C-terminal domain-containing protein n=1 Tax=Candidula unifasciata TaxID=100452 RepID=A0A8S4A1Q5_9EUPU|nr:unnamed protein product [Candidula unifasciata]